MQAIAQFLARAQAEPAGLILEGEAGIGKTTLWLDGIRQATEAGFVVLSASGSPAEARFTFAVAADLLRDVSDAVVAELPRVQQAALDRVLLRGNDGAPTEERSVAAGFLSVLESLARVSPVLVAIDDVQWLDTASRAVLGFAAHRLTGRIGLLASVRTGEPSVPDVGSWLRLSQPDAVNQVRLGPLSLGALHGIVAARIGRTLPRMTLVRIHEISGGNPFYALELARAYGDGSSLDVGLPASLSALVARRVEGVDAETAELLLTVAAAADPTTALLSRALRLSVQEVVDLIERAEAAAIVEYRRSTVRFTHPLLSHGVYSQASASRRRRTHRALAAAVDNPELRARHLALASPSGDAATIEALDAAAEIAAARGAPGGAAELLELAIGLGGGTVLRRLRAAELYFRAGSLPAAGRLLPTDVDNVPAGLLRCLALLLTGAIHAYADDLPAAVDAMTRALDEAGDNAAMRALCATRLALGLFMTGRMKESVDRAQLAVQMTEQLGTPNLHSRALSIYVVARFCYGLGVDHEALRIAVELEDPHDDATTWFRASAVQAMVVAWTGDLEAARAQLQVVRERMRAGGSELDIIWAANQTARIDIWLGNYRDAHVAAAEALQRASQIGGKQLLITAWNVQAEMAARTGDEATARSAAAASIEATRETGALHLTAASTTTLAFLEVSLGRYPAALTLLEPLLADFDGEHRVEINISSHLPDAVEALVAVGRVDEAEAIVTALEDAGARHDRRWPCAVGARGRAQLCAARGDLSGAERALYRALEHHDLLPIPFERARTELFLGQVQRRRRSRAAAARTLASALDTFQQIGSPLWAARARVELERTNLARTDGGKLTDTERRTAELAAAGLSNKEIAAELFHSVKSVEMNLTHVYRKLGIRSRSQLSAALAAR